MTNLPNRRPQQLLISIALNSSWKTNTLFRPGFGAAAKSSQRPGDNSGRNHATLPCYPCTAPSAAVPEVPSPPKAARGTAAGQPTSLKWPSSVLFLFGRKSLKGRKGRTNTSWKLRTVFVHRYLFSTIPTAFIIMIKPEKHLSSCFMYTFYISYVCIR